MYANDEDPNSYFNGEYDDYHPNGNAESTENDQEDNGVIATTVIEATRPVTILLTPILVKIVQELAEEIIKDVSHFSQPHLQQETNYFIIRIGIWKRCWMFFKWNILDN